MDRPGRDSLPEALHDAALSTIAAVTPRLRGWLHAAAFPLAVVGGVVLVTLADGPRARAACAIYAVTAASLFGISALYHRGRWSGRARTVLQRLDHANIFLIIAGTYTPFAVLVLPSGQGHALLAAVWAGAVAGVAFRMLWHTAPRWLQVPAYLALGWTAVFALPVLVREGGVVMTALIILGGALYSLGALVYAVRRPDPAPRIFGFHEVFHALTILAFSSQYIAVSLAAY